MTNIKAPEEYVNEAGAIKKAGKYIKLYGKNVLIISGHRAFEAIKDDLVKSLEENQIEYHIEKFTGYPTYEKARCYAEHAKKAGVDVLVGAGGGKVCDVTKAAGDLASLPVITIPTISATCACWAAVSVIYTDEGDFERFYQNRYTPRQIIVDPEVLVKAPERYLKSGIVDTYAKWYELAPGLKGREDTLVLQLSSFGAKLAYDILDDNYEGALKAVREGLVNSNFIDTVDAIFFLAGYVGTFVGARAYSGFAHPFYHSSRCIRESRKSLHGELVAYGILSQLVLEKKSEEEIASVIEKFEKIDQAYTLKDLGLDGNREENLNVIAKRTLDEFGGFTKLGFGNSVSEIYDGLKKTEILVEKYRKKGSPRDREKKDLV